VKIIYAIFRSELEKNRKSKENVEFQKKLEEEIEKELQLEREQQLAKETEQKKERGHCLSNKNWK